MNRRSDWNVWLNPASMTCTERTYPSTPSTTTEVGYGEAGPAVFTGAPPGIVTAASLAYDGASETISDHPASVPTSPAAWSRMYSDHVPFAGNPLNTSSEAP